MWLPCFQLLHKLRLIKPRGIVHVGANDGAEFTSYRETGAKPVLYIEPVPEVFERLKQRLAPDPNHYPLQYVCSDVDGEEVTFNIASNYGQSSSMLPLGKHALVHPDVAYIGSFKMKTRTLDGIIDQFFPQAQLDMLILDTQGSELKVLQGAHRLLKNLRYIYTEVSEEPLYEGSCTHEELTAFLKLYGFKLKNLAINYYSWGDALYVKEVKIPDPPPTPNLCLHKPAQQSSLSQWSKPNDAQGAVNGIKNGFFGFHTADEESPWWQVDLEAIEPLQEVRIYNRLDNSYDRIRTLSVLLSGDGKNWQPIFVNNESWIFGGIDGKPLVIPLPGVKARYIRLQLNEKNALHVDEVEAYGSA